MYKFQEKYLSKKIYGIFPEKIFGGPRPLGVSKFYKEVGMVERGHRRLSNV